VDLDVLAVEEGFEEGSVLLGGEVDEVEEGELLCVCVCVCVCVCM
jgi:hypothetical protein